MDMVIKGKKIVIALIIVTLMIEVINIVWIFSIYASNKGMDLVSYKLIQGIVRLILTAILMFFLYKGYNWARLITIILFGLGAFIALLSLISNFSLILLIWGSVNTLICLVLNFSKNVYIFLIYQRYKSNPDLGDDGRIGDNN